MWKFNRQAARPDGPVTRQEARRNDRNYFKCALAGNDAFQTACHSIGACHSSIVKLVPKDLLEKVRRDMGDPKGGGQDGARGRGAMIQAAWNSAWPMGT